MAGRTGDGERQGGGEPTRLGMVRWFAPRELIWTSLEVLGAYAVAWFVDPRAVFRGSASQTDEGVAPRRRTKRRGPPPNFDLRELFADRNELWFDYVSDLGDGWDSTYAIARLVASETLMLSLPAHESRGGSYRPIATRRGDLLVFGGDLAYPTPRANVYDQRLLAPYREATRSWKSAEDLPYVLALPGNHDWYDGLRGFRERFCRPGSKFAGWRTCQRSSYFAARLPHDVWLIGADTQLENAINPDQADYFRSVAREIESHHRIILCLATPDWMRPHAATADSVVDVMADLLGHEPEVCLAGHRHHYQRHSVMKPGNSDRAVPVVESAADPAGSDVPANSDEPVAADSETGGEKASITEEQWPGATRPAAAPQRITAGGGGAYLSPTHVPVHRSLRNRLHRHASFPPPSESRRYRGRLLMLPVLEPWFGMIPAVIYGLGCCLFLGIQADDLGAFFTAAKERAATLPAILFFVVLGLSTLMLRQRMDVVSFFVALLHTAAHLAGVLLVAYWVLPSQNAWRFLPVLLAGAVGWWVGSAIVGVYLWIASWFDRFVDVGYAALRIDDWKSFLRFHLDKSGNLTIYPIGLRRVPRAWSCRCATEASALGPEDARATEPELIEMPIRIPTRSEKH